MSDLGLFFFDQERKKDLMDHRDDSTFSFDPSVLNVKKLNKNNKSKIDSRKGVLASYNKKKVRRKKVKGGGGGTAGGKGDCSGNNTDSNGNGTVSAKENTSILTLFKSIILFSAHW